MLDPNLNFIVMTAFYRWNHFYRDHLEQHECSSAWLHPDVLAQEAFLNPGTHQLLRERWLNSSLLPLKREFLSESGSMESLPLLPGVDIGFIKFKLREQFLLVVLPHFEGVDLKS